MPDLLGAHQCVELAAGCQPLVTVHCFSGIYIHRSANAHNYRQTSLHNVGQLPFILQPTSVLSRAFSAFPLPPSPHFENSLGLYAEISRICSKNSSILGLKAENLRIISPRLRRQIAPRPVKTAPASASGPLATWCLGPCLFALNSTRRPFPREGSHN
jgi:hypothetical protein